MANQVEIKGHHYESVVEAYNRGELWSSDSKKDVFCLREGPVDLRNYKERRNKNSFAIEFW